MVGRGSMYRQAEASIDSASLCHPFFTHRAVSNMSSHPPLMNLRVGGTQWGTGGCRASPGPGHTEHSHPHDGGASGDPLEGFTALSSKFSRREP